MTARLSPKQQLFRSVSEKDWQRQVTDILELHGWVSYHTFDSRRSDKGFPDLVAIRARDGDMLVAELKRERGATTREQLHWLELFTLAGVDAYCWRPSDVDRVIERARWPNQSEVEL